MEEKKKRGRPKGSKNKKKPTGGRPKGSKNKPKTEILPQKIEQVIVEDDSIYTFNFKEHFDITAFKGNYKIKSNKCRVMEALSKCPGNVSKACKLAKISRMTLYNYRKKDEYFAQCLEEIQDIIGDFIEERAFNIAIGGDKQMIQFMLKNKFKDRGYVEKIETENINIEPAIINIIPAKKKDE